MITSTFCRMSDAPSVAMKTVMPVRPLNCSISPAFRTTPAIMPAAAAIAGVQDHPGDHAGGRGDQRGGGHALMEERLPAVGGVGTDGEELTVREVGDPAHRVLKRERDR